MSDLVFYRFQPDAMGREVLEKLFVGEDRQKLLKRLVSELKKAAEHKTPRHYLIVGSRGVGKTHFVTLLYYRLKDGLKDGNAAVIKLAEEEYSIYRVSDLLLRIATESMPEELEDDEIVKIILDELKRKNVMYIILIENINQILGEQMPKEEVKKLRSILQKENIFCIVATSPLVFKEVSEHQEPFFNFFEIIYLRELKNKEVEEFIRKIAEVSKDPRVDQYIQKIKVITTLTGGSPRIILLLYDLMSREKLSDVEEAFFKLLDENTPYYQDIFKMLSGEKRKVFDTLVSLGRPATPTEIAKKARMKRDVVNTILRRLETNGYVISRKFGRITKYEVRERLFRLWREIRREQLGRRRISILIEFLKLWYTPKELKDKFVDALETGKFDDARYYFWSLPKREKLEMLGKIFEKYYVEGRDSIKRLLDEVLALEEPDVKRMAFFEEYYLLLEKREYKKLLEKTEERLREEPYDEDALFFKSLASWLMNRLDEALSILSKLITMVASNETKAVIYESIGIILIETEKYEDALKALSEAIRLSSIPEVQALAWFYKGRALEGLKKYDEALKCLEEAHKLNQENIEILSEKGRILYILEKLNDALQIYLDILRLDPDNIEALFSTGIIYVELGEFKKALEVFSKMVKVSPSDPRGHVGKGLALIYLEELEDALKHLDRAVELNPSDELAFHLKAHIHLDLSLNEVKKKNFGNVINCLENFVFAFQKVHDKDLKEELKEHVFDFIKDLIKLKDPEILGIALKEIQKIDEFKELLKPIILALDIVKSKDLNKYYDLQVEVREVVAEVVREITGSDELIPEELKSL